MKRNHVAKDLRTPKYKMRVVKSKKIYSRKLKHKPLTSSEKEGNVELLAVKGY
jgi:hypothetical protein